MMFTILCILFSLVMFLKHYVGEGTQKYQRMLYRTILLTLIVVQYYNLWFALLKVPFDFSAKAMRADCLMSDKGGKMPEGNTLVSNKNPCFCHVNATCHLSPTAVENEQVKNDTHTLTKFVIDRQFGKNATSIEACKYDTESTCTSTETSTHKPITIERMISEKRDCNRGRGAGERAKQVCGYIHY